MRMLPSWISSCSPVGAILPHPAVRGGSWGETDRRARGRGRQAGRGGGAEQPRAEPRAQLLEAVIAEHLASLIDDAVAVEESEGRPEPAIVDELDHGVQQIASASCRE